MGENREVAEGKLVSDHGLFSSYEGLQGVAGKITGAFSGMHRAECLDAGSRASFTSSRPPPPWTLGLHLFLHVYS